MGTGKLSSWFGFHHLEFATEKLPMSYYVEHGDSGYPSAQAKCVGCGWRSCWRDGGHDH